MSRPLLPPEQINPAIRERVARLHADVLSTAPAAGLKTQSPSTSTTVRRADSLLISSTCWYWAEW
jgi:hypothetical protein